MPRHQKDSGFTLIEVLIALILMSLMMGLLFGSLRTGGRIWDAGAARAEETMAMQAAQQLLRRIIEESRPIRIRGADNRPVVAFDGTVDRLSFIATRPAAARSEGYYRYTLGTEDGEGKRLSLVMTPWSPATANRSGQEIPAEHIVLLEDIEGLDIAYFGVPDGAREPEWRADWRGMRQTPKLIRIEVVSAHDWPVLQAVTRIDGKMPVVGGRANQ